MCSDGDYYSEDEADGVCKECGGPTVNGVSLEHCNWSPVECEECGYAPCDGSC